VAQPQFPVRPDLDPARIRHGESGGGHYIFVPQTLSFGRAASVSVFIGEGLNGVGPSVTSISCGYDRHNRSPHFFRSTFERHADCVVVLCLAILSDEIIYVLFILPIKIKCSLVFAAFLLLGFVLNSIRTVCTHCLRELFHLFGPEIIRQATHRREVSTRRRRFEEHSPAPMTPCIAVVCVQTELSDPSLIFASRAMVKNTACASAESANAWVGAFKERWARAALILNLTLRSRPSLNALTLTEIIASETSTMTHKNMPFQRMVHLHLFYRVVRAMQLLSREEQNAAKTNLSSLVQEVRAMQSTQLLTLSVVTPKADSVSC